MIWSVWTIVVIAIAVVALIQVWNLRQQVRNQALRLSELGQRVGKLEIGLAPAEQPVARKAEQPIAPEGVVSEEPVPDQSRQEVPASEPVLKEEQADEPVIQEKIPGSRATTTTDPGFWP